MADDSTSAAVKAAGDKLQSGGFANKMKGDAKSLVGSAIGSDSLKVEGKVQEAAGKAQTRVGEEVKSAA